MIHYKRAYVTYKSSAKIKRNIGTNSSRDETIGKTFSYRKGRWTIQSIKRKFQASQSDKQLDHSIGGNKKVENQ